MKVMITLRDALADPDLLGNILVGPSFDLWRAVILATMGEELTPAELELFRSVAGGRALSPQEMVDIAMYLVGRRGGKDRVTSVLSAYISTCIDFSDRLSPGEIPTLLVVGPSIAQSNIQRSYIQGVFEHSPKLSSMVKNVTAETIELHNGVVVDVRAAQFRRLRGVTAIAAIITESAYLYDESASGNTDSELIASISPTLGTTGGPLILITTPYRKKGETYNIWRQSFGNADDPHTLVVQGASCTFNPTLPLRVVERALKRDEAKARTEYLCQWREDISDWVSREALDACVDRGVFQRPRQPNISYRAFLDPSGGQADSMALAIGYIETRAGQPTVVVSAVKEVPAPFDPESATDAMCATLREYGCSSVVSDRYAAAWVESAFQRRQVRVEHADKPKSGLYLELLPRIMAKTISLLDNERAVSQLAALERRSSRGGREVVDHPQNGGRDDVANCIAGLASLFNVASATQAGWYVYDRWSRKLAFNQL